MKKNGSGEDYQIPAMKGNRLYKAEKLRSKTVIERLFMGSEDESQRAISFPLRAVWVRSESRPDGVTMPRFLIMIPKKRLRHAVDRVKMRRRVREAYRLNKSLLPTDGSVEIAFVYVDNCLRKYSDVESSMIKLLNKINKSLCCSC